MTQPRHKTFHRYISDTEGKHITDENGETIAWVAVRKPITVEKIEEVVNTGQIKNYLVKKEKE